MNASLVQVESGLQAHMVAQVAAQQQVHQVLLGLQAKPPHDGGLPVRHVALPDPLARLEIQARPAGRHLVAASTFMKEVTLFSKARCVT